MADGNGGRRLTRRRVLGGVAGAAGVGLIGGAGTRAFLGDTEIVSGSDLGNPYGASYLDLQLSCGGSGTCSTVENGVAFSLKDISPDSIPDTEMCLSLAGNPAWTWLRTTPIENDLTKNLTLSLTYTDSGNAVIDPKTGDGITNYSLLKFLDAFSEGGMLDGGGPDEAFPASSTGEGRCIKLSWSLPADPGLSGLSAEFTLQFAAIQYRADASPTNPWGQS